MAGSILKSSCNYFLGDTISNVLKGRMGGTSGSVGLL